MPNFTSVSFTHGGLTALMAIRSLSFVRVFAPHALDRASC
jgi:hypothetical protein